MALPQAKHDALFRLIVADPGRASALLQDYLAPDIAALLDLDSPPEHVEGTAIDGEGRKIQADAIFRVRLRDGSDARVYVLLEHKSTVDARTPLQLLRYMLRLWIAEIERGDATDGKLSPIIPLVFYHGRGRWTPPLSIQEDDPGAGGHEGTAAALRSLRGARTRADRAVAAFPGPVCGVQSVRAGT